MKISERQRVRSHNSRARLLSTPATLTEGEWAKAISAFHGLCAYCQSEPFTILEHFLPIDVAGTTAQNCIPACRLCNNRKGDTVGDALTVRFGGEAIARIQAYLNDGKQPEILETPPANIARKTRPRRNLPPLRTVYVVDNEVWAEKLRGEGKIVQVMSLDDMARRR